MDKKAFQVLLAEDNPAVITIIPEALKHQHVECDLQIVCDGAKALAVIDLLDYLIVDMYLPRHDGVLFRTDCEQPAMVAEFRSAPCPGNSVHTSWPTKGLCAFQSPPPLTNSCASMPS